MTVEECYTNLGGDYQEVLYRFKNDKRIMKYLKMMLDDQNYELLKQSLESKDYKSAFTASHSLKGIALNLGLTNLATASANLTESLRNYQGNSSLVSLFAEVKKNYEEMQKNVNNLFKSTLMDGGNDE